MSATNIQWITIAVLGFGAIFAFFVLVFVFEATMHALRYRDQFAGGGGFRAPSFGGRRDSFGSSGLARPDPSKRRDPKIDRALAREAARLASGGTAPEPNERPVPDEPELVPDPLEPETAEAASAEPVIPTETREDDQATDTEPETVSDTVAFEERPGLSAPEEDAYEAEPEAIFESETIVEPQAPEPLMLTDIVEEPAQQDAQEEAPAEPALEAYPEDVSAKELSVAEGAADSETVEAENADAEAETDQILAEPQPALQPLKAERSAALAESRFSVKPLVATRVRLGQRDKREQPRSRLTAGNRPTPPLTRPAPEQDQKPTVDAWPEDHGAEATSSTGAADEMLHADPRANAEAAQARPTRTESVNEPETEAAPQPADEQVAATPDPEAAIGNEEARAAEPQRTSRVEAPSQPEEEVMADTTRQLKSLREAEQLGIGPQGGCPLYLRYKSSSGIVFDRIVQAVTLEEADGELIMRAYCHRSKAMRRIRVEHVVAAFDLKTRDVSVGGKVSEFISARVPMRDASDSTAAAE